MTMYEIQLRYQIRRKGETSISLPFSEGWTGWAPIAAADDDEISRTTRQRIERSFPEAFTDKETK